MIGAGKSSETVLTNLNFSGILVPLSISGSGHIAELCKGSTTDSDSVCLGSNPSSAATGCSSVWYECLVRDQEAMSSNLITPTTSRQVLLACRDFLCQKSRLRLTDCRSFSAKSLARLACSVVNALATVRCRYHLFAVARLRRGSSNLYSGLPKIFYRFQPKSAGVYNTCRFLLFHSSLSRFL